LEKKTLFIINDLFLKKGFIVPYRITFQNKAELNEENTYNQNFKGLYCVCSRPYPDPEDEVI